MLERLLRVIIHTYISSDVRNKPYKNIQKKKKKKKASYLDVSVTVYLSEELLSLYPYDQDF